MPYPASTRHMSLCREALEAQIAERAAQRQHARRALLQEPAPAWLAPASSAILVEPGLGLSLTHASTNGLLASSISVAAQHAAHHAGGREARGTEQGLGPAFSLAQGLRLPPLAPWQLERLAAQAGGAGAVAGTGGPSAPADIPARDHSSDMWPPERSITDGRRHDAAQASTAAAAGASINGLLHEDPHGAAWMGGSNPAPAKSPGHAAPDSPQRMGRRPAAAAASKPTPPVGLRETWADDPYRAGRLGRGRGQFSPERRSVAADAPAEAWTIGPEALPSSGGAAQHATGRKAVPVREKQPCRGMTAQTHLIHLFCLLMALEKSCKQRTLIYRQAIWCCRSVLLRMQVRLACGVSASFLE